MRKRILTISLYSLFFIFCLFFFLMRGFPIQILADNMKSSIEHDLGIKITTSTMAVLFPNGVKATDVRLIKPGQENAPGFTVLLDMVKARVSLLGLLVGRRSVSFSSELFSGSLDGTIGLDSERVRVNSQIEHIDLNKFPHLADILGRKVMGNISGAVDLDFSTSDLKTAAGAIEFDLEDVSIGEGSVGAGASGSSGISMPPLNLGKVQVDIQVDKGKAELKTFKQQSDDLEANLEGYILLAQSVSQFTQNYRVRFKPSANFLTKNPKFQTVIDLSGMGNTKDQQGFMVYKATGKLTNPQFQPVKR